MCLTTLPTPYVNKVYELKYRNVQLCIQISPRRNNAIFGPHKTLLEIASFRVEKGPPNAVLTMCLIAAV
jgi:hypothetical protein